MRCAIFAPNGAVMTLANAIQNNEGKYTKPKFGDGNVEILRPVAI